MPVWKSPFSSSDKYKSTEQKVTQKDIDKVHKENREDFKRGTDRSYREKPQLYKTQSSPTPKPSGTKIDGEFSKLERSGRIPDIGKKEVEFSKIRPSETIRSKASEILRKAEPIIQRSKEKIRSKAPEILRKSGEVAKRVASSPLTRTAINMAKGNPYVRAAVAAAGIGALAYAAKKTSDKKKITDAAKGNNFMMTKEVKSTGAAKSVQGKQKATTKVKPEPKIDSKKIGATSTVDSAPKKRQSYVDEFSYGDK